jgi:hypothetical protein
MKKTITKLSVVAFLGLTIFIACKTQEKTEASSYLPINVLPSCVVTPSEFKTWFVGGNPTENGAVEPANSVTFGHEDNGDFYRWSEQMFLWITSPSSGIYGKSKTVLESPVFYTVSPEFGVNERKLIPHRPGILLSALPNIEKSRGVDSEEGQATGDALMSKDGALLYYITMVNDVYAQFIAAVNAGKMKGKQFPTTQAELNTIVAYAKSQNIVLPDANALAIELKTSWVDASTVKDLSKYITIDALVPTYIKTSKRWTIIPNKTQKIKLALLGVHIVGSTAGHPEMVWSTFEHKNNAPNLSYTYLDTALKQQKIAADTKGLWVLNSAPADTTNINISHMKFKNDTISAQWTTTPLPPANNTISPSNTTRTKPWGVANKGVPNPENATAAASNSQIISINNSVLSQLVGNDIRKNYLFIGSTWTDGGAAPNGQSYSATNTTSGVAIGTSQLANSTMETYDQSTAYNPNGSCFSCHHDYKSSKPTLDPNFLSHVYADIRRGDSISGKKKVKLIQ